VKNFYAKKCATSCKSRVSWVPKMPTVREITTRVAQAFWLNFESCEWKFSPQCTRLTPMFRKNSILCDSFFKKISVIFAIWSAGIVYSSTAQTIILFLEILTSVETRKKKCRNDISIESFARRQWGYWTRYIFYLYCVDSNFLKKDSNWHFRDLRLPAEASCWLGYLLNSLAHSLNEVSFSSKFWPTCWTHLHLNSALLRLYSNDFCQKSKYTKMAHKNYIKCY